MTLKHSLNKVKELMEQNSTKAYSELCLLIEELKQLKQKYERQANSAESDMWKEIHAQVAFEIGNILGGSEK